LEVSGGPAGAVVFVNGQSVGTLPLRAPIHLEVGTVTLEVRQSGHYAVSRPIEVIAGRVARESVTLRGRSDADGVVSTSSTLRVDTPHSPLGALSWSPPSGALVLSGVGLVAMIAGGVIVGSYLEPSGRCNPCDQGTQQGRDATTAGYAVYGGDVAIAAGGALAAAGVVWLVVSYMTSSPPRRVAIVPMGSMLTATWSF
ncbi:MAG: PEGA domain-containing protein, partial [Deltaproteobacteria bacterium]